MTTAKNSQAAIAAPVIAPSSAEISQIACISLCIDEPEQAQANISQIAIISVDIEYELPVFYTPFYIGGIWGFPLWRVKTKE